MTVRGEDARRAGLGDGREQCGPIGVIGEDEPAIVRALTTDAADAHQAGGERVGEVAEPPHPGCAARRQRRQHELARERCAARPLGDDAVTGSIGMPASR